MSPPDRQQPSEDARYGLFIQRFTHHLTDLRRSIRSLLPNATRADETLQQTAIRNLDGRMDEFATFHTALTDHEFAERFDLSRSGHRKSKTRPLFCFLR